MRRIDRLDPRRQNSHPGVGGRVFDAHDEMEHAPLPILEEDVFERADLPIGGVNRASQKLSERRRSSRTALPLLRIERLQISVAPLPEIARGQIEDNRSISLDHLERANPSRFRLELNVDQSQRPSASREDAPAQEAHGTSRPTRSSLFLWNGTLNHCEPPITFAVWS